jgi:hypothetical protein
MAKRGRPLTTGRRLDLDEPLKGQLADFLAAHHGASQKDVLHDAIRAYIKSDLEKNQGVKEEYEKLQAARREGRPATLHVIKSDKTG